MTQSSNSRIYQFVFQAGDEIEENPLDFSLMMMRTVGATRIASPKGATPEILYRGPFIPSQEQIIAHPQIPQEK